MTAGFLRLALASILLIASGCASVDSTHGRRFDNLVIQGTNQFGDQVEKALALIRSRSPAGYAIVTNYLGIIQEHKSSGMEVHHKRPIFQLNGKSAYHSVTWCAGVVAHDSFHSKLYFDYRKRHPWVLWMPSKVHSGEQAERACLEHQLVVLKDIGAPDSEINWCRQCMSQTNHYWKVKYKDRSW